MRLTICTVLLCLAESTGSYLQVDIYTYAESQQVPGQTSHASSLS